MVTKILSFVLLLLVQFTYLSFAQADYKEATVFDIRKNLPLTDSEPILKDFYINMGTESGVRVGTQLSIYRKIPVIDIYRNRAQGDLVIEVARVRVIHTQKDLSVARVVSYSDPQKVPVAQFEKIMLGDRVEFAPVTAGPRDEQASNAQVAPEESEVEAQKTEAPQNESGKVPAIKGKTAQAEIPQPEAIKVETSKN